MVAGMLGAKKQKSWLTDQAFAKKYGFEVVDTTESGYELLALSLDGTTPKFTQTAKTSEIESKELTIYYDLQCPYVQQNVEIIRKYCSENDVAVSLIHGRLDCFGGQSHSFAHYPLLSAAHVS